ncbi:MULTISPECIES: hypothetical protein [Sphingomonas]|uniref:hypothetical protein n=1 Tax=Sphingomonas TaxID=13687 RepID=UPI000F7F64E6|nr:hypothetical protein GCM10017606_21280 [Microbacterium terregens]
MGWEDIAVEAEAMDCAAPQRANLRDLINAADALNAPQSITVNPYDGGISLHWIGCDFEIAIYDDHYESYRFSNGETAIRHWPHAPGDPVEAVLLEQIGGAGPTASPS